MMEGKIGNNEKGLFIYLLKETLTVARYAKHPVTQTF